MMKRRNKITAIALSALLSANMAVPSIAFAKTSIEKDESIFVNMDSEGKIESQIGSVWLHSDKEINYSENTKLKDIKNLKGKEEFKLDQDKLSWDLASKEVYYQGHLEEDMPIDIKVSYSLDGKSVKKEDLKDVSGKLKINVDMVNRDEEYKMINGKNQKIYVPHAALTTMIFDVDEVSNVKINSGKIVNEGKKVVATNLAMPGMSEIFEDKLEELDVDLNKLFKDSIEVEMEVKEFTMPSIMVVIADEDLDTEKIDKSNDLDELLDGLNELKENSDKIMDGITELNKGSKELQEGTGKLSDGVSQLNEGGNDLYDGILKVSDNYGKLSDGSGQLKDGLNELSSSTGDFSKGTSALYDGVNKLKQGSKALAEGSANLEAGAGQLYDGIKSVSDNSTAIVGGVEGLKDGSVALNEGLNKLDQGLNGYVAGTDALIAQVEALNNLSANMPDLSGLGQMLPSPEALGQVKALIGFNSQKAEAAKAEGNMEEYKAYMGTVQSLQGIIDNAQAMAQLNLDEILGQLPAGMTEEEIQQLQALKAAGQALKEGSKNALAGSGQLKEGSLKLNQGVAQLPEGTKALLAGAEKVKNGASQLNAGLVKMSASIERELLPNVELLNNGSQALSQGAQKLNDGIISLDGGINRLAAEGINPLVDGSSKLHDGLNELDSKTGELTDGVNKLNEGTAELEDGYSKFNEEGIYKLTDEAKEKTDNIKDLIELKDAVFDLAKDRDSITGTASDMDVVLTQKYIIKID